MYPREKIQISPKNNYLVNFPSFRKNTKCRYHTKKDCLLFGWESLTTPIRNIILVLNFTYYLYISGKIQIHPKNNFTVNVSFRKNNNAKNKSCFFTQKSYFIYSISSRFSRFSWVLSFSGFPSFSSFS